VRGDDGKPVDGIVTLIPDPPKPEQAALCQVADTTEGRFQFQGIRPGKYRLYAWEELESGSHLDPQVTAPYLESSVAIEAAENGRQEVTLKRISVDQMEAAATAPAAK
jgi:protocatechuate 3,4-dioxygenase beta subunit